MSSLGDTVVEFQQTVRKKVSGIKTAPDYPPEKASDFPFLVTYPGDGLLNWDTTEQFIGLHTIVVEFHIARKDLPFDVQSALVFAESIPNALYAGFKDDSISTPQTFGAISYTFGALSWAGQDTVGFRWEVSGVKILTSIS